LHFQGKRLQFHLRVGVNVAGRGMAVREKINFRFRAEHGHERVRPRVVADVLAMISDSGKGSAP